MNFLPFLPIPPDHETFVPEGRANTVRRYVLALAAVGVSFVGRLLFHDTLGDSLPYTLFNPAVLLASVYGGFGPALCALILSALLGDYFFQKPYHAFHVSDAASLLRIVLFLVAGLFICVLGGLLEAARRRARDDALELRRQAAQFRASDKNYRRMIETAYEGICCLDDQDRVTYVNGRMVDMLGYSIIGMVGHLMSDFAFEEDRPRLEHLLARRRQGGKEVFDFRLRCKNASAIYCVISTQSIFDRDDRYHGLLNMVTDITARCWSAEDVNQLLDGLKAQVQSLQGLQQTAFARLGPPANKLPDAAPGSGALDEARQAIARSMELSDQIAILLRTGKTEPEEPALVRLTASRP